MYQSTSAEVIIAVVVIMLFVKPLLKSLVDAFDKNYKNDQDKRR